MNYRAFFSNSKREWTLIRRDPDEYRSSDGYLLAWEYDPKYGSYIWNLYNSEDICIGHNVPDDSVLKA